MPIAAQKLVPLGFQQAVDPLLGLLEQAATRASAEVSRVAANKAGETPSLPLRGSPGGAYACFLRLLNNEQSLKKEISHAHNCTNRAERRHW